MYTHYCPISRDAAGLIQRIGTKKRIGKAPIPESGGASAESRVVSVESGAVAGWGDAQAIGRVEVLIDGQAVDPVPTLALLY